VRRATLLALLAVVACNDVRDYRGTWSGARVGDVPALRVGVAFDAHARLAIDEIDAHGLRGRLDLDGFATGATVLSVEGAEADALGSMTFAGSPSRVYLAFADTTDGGGQLLLVIALYDGHRVELRVVRGGPSPVYAIFTLGAA
jgi:hypothetical protein